MIIPRHADGAVMTSDEVDAEIRKRLSAMPAEDRSWNQGLWEFMGLRLKQDDIHTCMKCGYSYHVRRLCRFLPDATVDYYSAPDPGCPKCAEKQ